MCGIIGIISQEKKLVEKSELDVMLDSLSRRGPDDKGTLEFENCALGQTRLSIIDLSSGHQPMRDNKRNMAIAYNGEIYNYRELKKDLENRGYVFATNSDTEVIMKSYQEYGTECLGHLDGMFALAIWNEEDRSLFLARDRFGKKPLYYAYDDRGNLLLASEIKALLASGRIKGELDPEALDNYLALMYVPPWRTIYKNVFALGPAECAVYKNGRLEKRKYWALNYKPLAISYADAKAETKRLLYEAVRKRLVADVEIGSFLSGGTDSTLITAYAQELSGRPLKTFSLGYGERVSELPYAKEASRRIGTDHYTLEADEKLLEELKKSLAYFDEPHADSSDFPQSILSKFAAGKVKVALSGDGADELFMGYGWYTRHRHLSFRAHTFEKLFLDPFRGYLRYISIFSERERRNLLGGGGKAGRNFVPPGLAENSLGPLTRINLFDLSVYLPGQLLAKIDRMGMMHSLEVRSPFLDHHLAEFVFNLPDEYKTDDRGYKVVLKDILSEIMPREFVYRRKQGFGAPVKDWLKTKEVGAFVNQKLGTGALINNLLEESAVKGVVDSFYTKKDDSFHYKIWLLFCLELWLESLKN